MLTAKVVDVQYPVEGKYGQQIRFNLVLPNGYECASWMKYYSEPSDKSALGSLSITFMNAIKGPVESVKDVLEGIKKLGCVYVKCSGFREYNEKLYPKFKVVPNKFPPTQENIGTPMLKEEPPKPSEMDLDRLTPEQRKQLDAWLRQ